MTSTARDLARTYSDREYPDPWQKVLDYRRVRAYAADHPEHGRTRVGNALDRPPERVRGRLDGGMPDPVRGIQTAIDHGWLDPGAATLDPGAATTAAFVAHLAHVLAGGSINGRFVPAITVDDSVTIGEVRSAFNALNVDILTRNAEVDNRATEAIPAADASVFGRCLVAIGAPVGAKAGLDSFPQIVREVTDRVRESFARIYVAHRALAYATKRHANDPRRPGTRVSRRPPRRTGRRSRRVRECRRRAGDCLRGGRPPTRRLGSRELGAVEFTRERDTTAVSDPRGQ